jgi:hypothetical protein
MMRTVKLVVEADCVFERGKGVIGFERLLVRACASERIQFSIESRYHDFALSTLMVLHCHDLPFPIQQLFPLAYIQGLQLLDILIQIQLDGFGISDDGFGACLLHNDGIKEHLLCPKVGVGEDGSGG